ncbi:MAG TPA: dimethylsulfonioproprionate lyase family protein [Nordella sp.]|nr:dimethylsulfonioproprionate lyase family protein [Nordella sp.]
MNDNIYGPAMWVIEAIRTSLKGEGAADVKARLAVQDLSPTAAAEPGPRRLAATRYFAECVATSMFLAPEVAAALAEIEEFLHWQQNPNYSDAVMGEGYMDNYAYAEIIGPNGFFPGEDFLLGLLLLGPHRLYRDHHHPAPELYWLLTGPSDWRKEQSEFRSRAAGETIWHPPRMSHATRTRESPLLAVYAWTRDTGAPARLVEEA